MESKIIELYREMKHWFLLRVLLYEVQLSEGCGAGYSFSQVKLFTCSHL
jgi:hypothetical protein